MKSFPLTLVGLFLMPSFLSAATSAAGGDITFTLPRAAKVSLNVLDEKGWIVRELLRADEEQPGAHTVHWDGNDQFGRPQPPGTYSWKLLHHTGLKAEYVLSVGNSGQPPYRTDDNKGSWGACHGNPMSVQADATGLYLTWMTQEGNAVFAHTDYDGKAIYKIDNSQGWGRNWDSVIVGNTLYRLEDSNLGSFLEKYDVQTGKFTKWDVKNAQVSGGKLRIQPEPLPLRDQKPPQDPAARKIFEATRWLFNDDAKAIAANEHYVVASFPALNKIALFKTTGEALPDLAIQDPHGLLFLPDGRLLVAQTGKITAIKLADRSVQPFLAQNLDNPWGIALGTDGRSLWITDQGRSNQVKQFSLDGKLLKAFGAAGGMNPEGKIDHLSFYNPRGIAKGLDGNIYVTEDSPLRRISRWSADGKLAREWFGPEGPQRSCWPNLNNFGEVYYQSSTEGVIQCDVDLKKKTWYPVAWSQTKISKGQAYVFESHGRKFLYGDHGTLFVLDAKSGAWLPAVEFRTLDKGPDKKAELWTDLNGNGQTDEGETASLPLDKLKAQTRLSNLNLGFGRFDPATFVLTGVFGNDVARLTPSRITAQGLPVYDFNAITPLTQQTARGPDGWADQMIYATHGSVPAADGGFFTAYNGGRQGCTSAWDRANWNRLVKFGPDGRMQWQAGVHSQTRTLANPADVVMFMRVAGLEKGVVFLTDVEAQFHAYTDDGLYVAALLDNGRPLTPNSLCVENVMGLVAQDPATRESYLFAGSTEDSRIWHLSGFETFQRMQGTVKLATPDIPPASDTYVIAATKPPREKTANDYGADGFLNEPEWRMASELPLVEDGVLKGRVYVRHDDRYLWIGAHIVDGSPARNSAQEPEMAFIHGDALDLYFGVDAGAGPKRPVAGVGDVRVLLYPTETPGACNGVIVLTRMKVAAGAEKHPFEFASPVGSAVADSVTTVAGKDAVTGAGLCNFYRWPNGAGYTVEANIPLEALSELGLSPSAGQGQAAQDHFIAFDAGVIFSNDAGNDRASRLYWHQDDQKTHMVMDLPTEGQFYPNLWGRAKIGAVPAK